MFVRRVLIENYRSIAACDVTLGPLTFLVGPNGAGKSNFLDALRFVADSLRGSVDHALRDRGGIGEVRRRSAGHPTHFGVRLFVDIDGVRGHYGFKIGARKHGGFEVQREECSLGPANYVVVAGQVTTMTGADAPPPAARDRLYLVHAAGRAEYRPLFDVLSSMAFYNLNPKSMREAQPPDPGDLLARDGANAASVLDRLTRARPDVKALIVEYLGRVVPGIEGVGARMVGPLEILEFQQQVVGAPKAWKFYAGSMSDGTLRALGVLLALFQSSEAGKIPLIGIEEPEVALHPAAAGILRDCLREASARSQVLVTSHSPDLLDDRSIGPDELLAVVGEGGTSRIGPIDETGRSILKDQLYTPGELLKLNQLFPDPHAVSDAAQMDLFRDSAA